MAGRMRKSVGAAIVALALMGLAGQAMALPNSRIGVGPLGGPARWPEVWRMQRAAGVSVLTPAGTILTLRPRTVGVFGRAGWGDYRLIRSAR